MGSSSYLYILRGLIHIPGRISKPELSSEAEAIVREASDRQFTNS